MMKSYRKLSQARLLPSSKVNEIPGVTAKEVAALKRLGLYTVEDVLRYLPSRHNDFGNAVPIKKLRIGEQAVIVGEVINSSVKVTPRRRMQLAEVWIRDEGGIIVAVFYNQPLVAKILTPGKRVALAGKVYPDVFGAPIGFQNPIFRLLSTTNIEDADTIRYIPHYRLTNGLTSERFSRIVKRLISVVNLIEDELPASTLARHNLIDIKKAIVLGHFPNSQEDILAAKRRIAFAELLLYQLVFIIKKLEFVHANAPIIPYRQEVIEQLKSNLPFELTKSQRHAIWQIYKDMQKPIPMNILLHGDVGSGKTVVAAAAAAMVGAAGYQVAFLAPTEILARQHYSRLCNYLEGIGLNLVLLVGGLRRKERLMLLESIAKGAADIVIGTHALLESDVRFNKLGLVIVDEQHRFGAVQREVLKERGYGTPHLLSMSATPIPRTLALARYGDIDTTYIERPAATMPRLSTKVLVGEQRVLAYNKVREELARGHKAYVICPLIEEDEEKGIARAATKEYERVKGIFVGAKVGLLHGQMAQQDKENVMKSFAGDGIDVLVSTTVVEVGVDVPLATVMIVEGAERFGLSQLHQLRGRIGRSGLDSWCFLCTDDLSDQALARLTILERTMDGMEIAEMDMRLRGAGQLFGERQSGLTDIAMEALLDGSVLKVVEAEAKLLMVETDNLRTCEKLAEMIRTKLNRYYLS